MIQIASVLMARYKRTDNDPRVLDVSHQVYIVLLCNFNDDLALKIGLPISHGSVLAWLGFGL